MFVISSFIVVPFLQKKQLHLASPEPPRAPTWKKDPMLGQPRTVSRMAWNFSSGFSPVHMALSKKLWLKSLWENKQFGSNSFPSYPIQKETKKKLWLFWHGVQHKSNQQLVRISAPIQTKRLQPHSARALINHKDCPLQQRWIKEHLLMWNHTKKKPTRAEIIRANYLAKRALSADTCWNVTKGYERRVSWTFCRLLHPTVPLNI